MLHWTPSIYALWNSSLTGPFNTNSTSTIYIYILSETCHNVIIFGNRMKQKIAGPFIISIHLLFMVLLCVIHRILRKKKHLRLARTELFALCAQQLNLLGHYVVLLAVATTLSCKFENSAKKSCNNRHRLHWVVYPADNDRYNKSKQLMPFFSTSYVG